MNVSLKSARVNCGLNLKEAANKIGISEKTLRSWETYQSYPTVDQLSKIESAYNINYDDITFLPPEYFT